MKQSDRIGPTTLSWRGLAAAGSLFVAGCEKLSRERMVSEAPRRRRDARTARSSRASAARRSMAQEFTPADLSPDFRSNGTSMPENPQYQAMVANAFASYRLKVDGLVDQAGELLARRPARVAEPHADHAPRLRRRMERDRQMEGRASCSALLDQVQPAAEARYVVLPLRRPHGGNGVESLLREHRHGRCLPRRRRFSPTISTTRRCRCANGAPIRLRVERQLGYKHAKYVMRIELVSTASTRSQAARAATGRTRATSGTPASDPGRLASNRRAIPR